VQNEERKTLQRKSLRRCLPLPHLRKGVLGNRCDGYFPVQHTPGAAQSEKSGTSGEMVYNVFSRWMELKPPRKNTLSLGVPEAYTPRSI
jgi:hypothetical protein